MFSFLPCRFVRHIRSVILAMGLSVSSVPAQALQLAGVEVADHAWMAGASLTLNGSGVRRMFGFRVYVAALYLALPAREPGLVLERDLPRRLQVILLRDTSTDQNLEALKCGLEDNNSAAEMEAIKPEVTRFLALLRQVHEVPAGTMIQFDYLPGRGTHTRIGNHDLGIIPGELFNRALLKIWLGDHPIQFSLKQSLLGLDGPTL